MDWQALLKQMPKAQVEYYRRMLEITVRRPPFACGAGLLSAEVIRSNQEVARSQCKIVNSFAKRRG